MELPSVTLQTRCQVKPDSPSKYCHRDNVFTHDATGSLLTPICFPLGYHGHFLHIKRILWYFPCTAWHQCLPIPLVPVGPVLILQKVQKWNL